MWLDLAIFAENVKITFTSLIAVNDVNFNT